MFAASASAEELVMEYSFERPETRMIVIGGESYDQVIMPGAPNGGKIGQPSLPSSGANILLPPGHRLESIEIVADNPVFLGDGYYIEPVQPQVKIGKYEREAIDFVPADPDKAIYEADAAFPKERFENIGVHKFRGYRILNLKLQPVEYQPAGGELYYFPVITVIVKTVATGQIDPMFRDLSGDESEVMAKVDNPETAPAYGTALKGGTKSYDMLILTTPTLASYFQPLKDYHDTTGIITEIHTTTDVGSSDPDDIRDYIHDRYLNDGIDYVLIGADDNIIPAKDLYVKTDDGIWAETEYNMPGDLYYGCLDGTWNYDGDSYWGEPTDGEGGGDVDLVAEVYYGRASVDNGTEASRFVTKTIWYLSRQHTMTQNVLLPGEYLGFEGIAEYAAPYLEKLIDGCSDYGYTTVGIPSDQYDIEELFDRDWPGNDWAASELIDRMNSGLHIVNHLGHGSPTSAMKLTNSTVLSDLTNDELFFLYSQTCLAGHFDDEECFAEHMNIKTDHGAFAVIMNARYGFGQHNSTDGASQRFDREFWDAIFNTSEGKPQIGKANQDSKEDNLYRVNEDYMRWCYYELNLFGDPTVQMLGVSTVAFEYPEGIPETVTPGMSTTFPVNVFGVGDGIPVPGSGMLYYSVNGHAFLNVAMTQLGGDEYEATLPPLACGDIIEFYVSAEEAGSGTVVYNPRPTSPNVAIPATGVITVFADDFETDQGWTTTHSSWQRGVPTGGGGEYGGPDPTGGYDGPNVFGYNLGGDYENGISERHLTSPAIDCSSLSHVTFNFWRWLGVEQPDYDHAYIKISTNGSTWTTIWENSGTMSDGQWVQMEFDISQYADDQPTVYLRWTMGSTDGSWRYCGWNIDGVEVTGLECDTNTPKIASDNVPDWTVDYPYTFQLEYTGGIGLVSWSDKYNDLTGTGLSLDADGLISGTPGTAGPLSFTAMVTDEEMQIDEKIFDFVINPGLSIVTASLPNWTEGVAYSRQLATNGGTAPLVFVDQNNGLAGTGLSLTAGGGVVGTPTTPGPIAFTAEVTDTAEALAQRPYGFTINPAVAITTTSVPNAQKDVPYSYQLDGTGGTGTLTWSDKNDDLDGTGLALGTDGLLSGTPTIEGLITFTARTIDNIGSYDEEELSLTVNVELAIVTTTLPAWTIGNPYSQQLAAGGGVGELTWTDKNNDLDGTGLTLSTAGLLSGVVTEYGDISFTAVVTDEAKASDEHPFTITFNPSLTIVTETMPEWTWGINYSYQLLTAGGTGDVFWADKDSDLDGSGLSLGADGILHGVPMVEGDITFTARAHDQGGDNEEKTLSLHINPKLTITTESISEVTVGSPTSFQLEVSGGTGAATWVDANDGLVGTGLTLSATGELSGNPTQTGFVFFTARATDQVGSEDEHEYTFMINQALQITSTDPPDWTVGCAYARILFATGGSGIKTWTDLNGDLDGTGLVLESNGGLNGTPTATGDITFTAHVEDASNGVDEKVFTFTINPALALTTTTAPDWTVDRPYSLQLECTGGTGQIDWSDLSGDLDGTGLNLSPTGLLSGIPGATGPIDFTARLVDEGGDQMDHPYAITINPAVAITTATTLPGATQGAEVAVQLEATGGTGEMTWTDVSGNLDGTGLSLGTDGQLTGAPNAAGTITFTAEVVDVAGSNMQKVFHLDVQQAYVCGDVNDDEEVNILDIVFLINYKYKDGPAPETFDAGDVNNDDNINILDIIFLINYKYKEGPEPIC